MGYNLNIESLSLRNYKDILKQQNLLPGRRILLQNIDENFDFIEKQGIANVSQLIKSLSSPQRIASFSSESGVTKDYLVILKREISALEQKPVSIANFPGIDPSLIESLNNAEIMNSKDYWEQNQSSSGELFSLCDLVRINGVGPIAARAFYEAGYKSVSSVAEADAAIMLEKVSVINDVRHYYRAKLGIKDMQFCIDFARLLCCKNV